jgi:hypothetical protein
MTLTAFIIIIIRPTLSKMFVAFDNCMKEKHFFILKKKLWTFSYIWIFYLQFRHVTYKEPRVFLSTLHGFCFGAYG